MQELASELDLEPIGDASSAIEELARRFDVKVSVMEELARRFGLEEHGGPPP